MAKFKSAAIVAKVPSNLGLFIDGTNDDDILYGMNYGDTIHGRGGEDHLHGGGGDDRLFGDEGDDTLSGGTGNDTLDGGIGNDTLVGGAGADKFIGGADFDTVSYASASIGVAVDMATAGITNDAEGDTYVGIERIVGSNFGDILTGDAGDNNLDGGNGDDFLFGGAGHDTLIGGYGSTNTLRGGAGNDVLIAGSGFDRLTGDDPGTTGFDHFVLTRDPTGRSVATITDFQSGYDVIDLFDFQSAASAHVPLQFGNADPGTLHQYGGHDVHGLVFDPWDHTLNHVTFSYNDLQHSYQIDSSVVMAVFTGGDIQQGSDVAFVEPPDWSPPAAVDAANHGLLLV